MQSSFNNFKSLHIIRGLCALIVLIYHSKFVLWSGGNLYIKEKGVNNFFDYIIFGIDMLSSCGNQCVLLFFVLSGFVIYFSFNNSNKKLCHFYIIRVLRIYLPYLFSLFFGVVTLFIIVKLNSNIAVEGIREYNSRLLLAYNDLSISSVLKALFFIQSKEYAGFNFAYWSLFHEAIFYLAFPIYYFLGFRVRIIIFLLFIVVYYFLRTEVLYYQLYFLVGMFLYDYYKTSRKLVAQKNFYILILVLSFVSTNLFVKMGYRYFADFSALIVITVAFDYIIINGIKKNKYLIKLADMSYSLYLNHLAVLMICYSIFNKLLNKVIFFERYPYYLGVIVSLVLCYVFYFFIEKKSLILISKIKEKWS